jgi:large subunit ribosomal protein L17
MAMLRNMVTSLFVHERIRTTDAKAKEVRRLADRMITLAKRGDLHARRQASTVVRSKEVTRKLFTELADRYQKVAGGYSRVIKLGPRRGDGAMIALVELVTPAKAAPARKQPVARRARARAAPKASAKPAVKEPRKTPKRLSGEEKTQPSAEESAEAAPRRPTKKSPKTSTRSSPKESTSTSSKRSQEKSTEASGGSKTAKASKGKKKGSEGGDSGEGR